MKTRERWRSAPFTTLDLLIDAGPILIFAPHADDETIGCGGLIRQARARGIAVWIDVLTDGGKSHPASLTHDRHRLAASRRVELTRAVGSLGVATARIAFWNEGDSELDWEGDAGERLVARARSRIAETGASTVFVTWVDDPHRDHEAAFAIAYRAVTTSIRTPRLFAYPVWSWTVDTPFDAREARVFRLDIADDLPAKRAALACHASQLGHLIQDDPTGFTLTPNEIALFMQPVETFIEVMVPPYV